MKLKTINNPTEFFEDLEKLFNEKVFLEFSLKYLDNNLDDDIFSSLFIVYFILKIYFPSKNPLITLQELLNKRSLIPFIKQINQIKNSKNLILN